jgi:hypothetical protein
MIMSKKAFDQIMEGLTEALAFARGELKGGEASYASGDRASAPNNPGTDLYWCR